MVGKNIILFVRSIVGIILVRVALYYVYFVMALYFIHAQNWIIYLLGGLGLTYLVFGFIILPKYQKIMEIDLPKNLLKDLKEEKQSGEDIQ